MTITSQAEAIRDEVSIGANTAERVGGCLVDIGEAIETRPCYAYASTTNNATGTSVSVAGTFYKAAITALTDRLSNGFTVTADGSIVYAPADGKTRVFKIDISASMYCATGSHVIIGRIGDDSVTFTGSDAAATTANAADKEQQVCLSGIFEAADGDVFRLWITEKDYTENVTVTHLNITAVQVGLYATTLTP